MDIKYYKVYDVNKRFIRKIQQKDELQEDNFLKGVTCFVINKKGEILIEQRASKSKLMSGQLDLCSGHVDNEETYTQAMIREYVEELHSGDEEDRRKAVLDGREVDCPKFLFDMLSDLLVKDENNDEYITFNDNPIDADYIEKLKEYSSKILDISNGIVYYDLIDREEKLIGECEHE